MPPIAIVLDALKPAARRRAGKRVEIAIMALLFGFIAAASLAAPPVQPPSDDTRERIVLDPAGRNQVLHEMRTMLQSVSDILNGLAQRDFAAAASAARKSGTGAAVDLAPSIRDRLPPAFRDLGMSTHRQFDAVADKLSGSAAIQDTMADLYALTLNCVACHDTYRLDETR